MITVKAKLKDILHERGVTQVWLSEKTGIPQGTISRFDRNERHEIRHVFTIARALNLKVDDLFDIIENQ